MDRFVGKVAVVTGASSGIGEAVSKELVKKGLIVVGLARRIDKLEIISTELLSNPNLYLGKFHPRQCDICNVKEIEETFQWISKNVGFVSILVNNAGALVLASLTAENEENFNKMFDTNVKGLLMCSKVVINSMINNGSEGHIININSVAGRMLLNHGRNEHYVYSASKHAVTVLSEGLRREMVIKKLNIKITNLSPGAVQTAMLAQAAGSIAERSPQLMLVPEDVAKACVAVLDTPPEVLISELTILPIHQHV